MDFKPFPKLARLNRDIVITEKIDGTNAQVCIVPYVDVQLSPVGLRIAMQGGLQPEPSSLVMFAGSRTRWITPTDDNFGFAKWVQANAEELFQLGPGQHFGEWWGQGIQRKYGLTEKRFSLFNTGRWLDRHTIAADLPPDVSVQDIEDGPMFKLAPACCRVVPVLFQGRFTTEAVEGVLNALRLQGSQAAPGFNKPEGIVIYHTAAGIQFKVTLDNDGVPKSKVA